LPAAFIEKPFGPQMGERTCRADTPKLKVRIAVEHVADLCHLA
jgi:hypothetical protein